MAIKREQSTGRLTVFELPPYSYVTGKFPHPSRDPAGHSFGKPELECSPADPVHWQNCIPYVWGIDLFNHGFYWESHESWEAVWHAVGRTGTVAEHCQALIKLAAAGVKAREGRISGVERHARRARELFESVAAQIHSREDFMGLRVRDLIDHAMTIQRQALEIVNTSDSPVVTVMPFTLDVLRN